MLPYDPAPAQLVCDFCRAMLSAYGVMRCKVRASVTFVDSVETNKLISSIFFSPSGSHIILVLPHQTSWQYSDGNLPNGGCRMQVG